ncbi:MAG: hypothetical protein UW27_C0010G0023 [Parcubacteria group bacterium GW2011_GWA1_44_13]|uniref:DUF5673 domain-containing protein n=1 Tax=Candidatus Nomurabacteria bacterium GW2011_GWB1_44_12 TaxID=1618748 RepID=A0A837IA56_9BACT|nr:MAG: hypothetical protein UW25_C0004G0301 [Candidatus Nomurabacteria bacterium GW2011_GWB1_44_12]KKT37743.1 MAG: hypothetical protein UW27_C0010G0023 [Parcubacteria group bacterium GW2011_GWA1_44_13]HBB43970.1 hypothetical protein [Candidatus Yonathbacteria bacterium]
MEEYDYQITWSAPEHEHREHSADWYWAVGIISVSLAVAFIIVNNMLLSVIILLGMGTLLFHAKHPPKILDYKLSKKGVSAGDRLYPWETLESFWVLEGKDDLRFHRDPKILLTSKKTFMPHIVIPLTNFVIDEVHQSLSHMLHEEPQAEPLPERLMRKIGF